MENSLFMRADEVAKELGVSRAYAYKLIKKLNEELRANGYLTISGRLNRAYFTEKVYKKNLEKENQRTAKIHIRRPYKSETAA